MVSSESQEKPWRLENYMICHVANSKANRIDIFSRHSKAMLAVCVQI